MQDDIIMQDNISAVVEEHEFTPFQQWEIAFIYAFACTFNPQHENVPTFYRLPDFDPLELEQEIQKQDSQLIHQLICSSLGNLLNRKQPIESFKNSLQQLVTDKMKLFEINFDSNPLTKQNFNELTIDVKLYLIHSIIEWQLHDSLAVKSIIEYNNNNTPRGQINPIVSLPFGIDSNKRTYWQFGDSCWVWREKIQFKPNYNGWETVCRNRQDLDELVNVLSNSSNRNEKALAQRITNELYEIVDKEERKKARKERAEMRKLIPVEISITSTTLRNRGNQRVRYNYDEDNDNIFGDDEYEEGGDEEDSNYTLEKTVESSPPIVVQPTRWSSRLNHETATELDIEE